MVDYSNLASRAKARQDATANKIETVAEELIHIVERRLQADPNDDVVKAMLALGYLKDGDPKLLPVLTLLSGKKSAADKVIEMLGGKTKKDDAPAAPAAIAPTNYGPGVQERMIGGKNHIFLPQVNDDGTFVNGTHKDEDDVVKEGYRLHFSPTDGKLLGYRSDVPAATPVTPTPDNDPVLPVHGKGVLGLGSKATGVTMKHSEAKASDQHDVVYHQKTGQPIKVVPASGWDKS
ncbi:hypothetical protein EYC59_04550 [Candidatus Saccharibacteria bacterium]|nr:MAG: hypothetical protein EYC59_04550 [Candidatus Saccharibacteria bacterium]